MATQQVLEFKNEDELEFEDASQPPRPTQPARKTEAVFAFDPEPSAQSAPEVVTGVVREWHQHSTETLPQIHDTIDSWGGKRAPAVTDSDLRGRVDKLTRKVKSREVTVQETVTEYVEEPVEAAEWQSTEPQAKSERPKAAKRKPRLFGFFGPRKTKQAVDAAVAARQPAAPDYQPQCSALTSDGAQCRNSARGDSKYCSSHKGYQPPTAKGIAKRVEGDAWDPRDKVTDRSTVRRADTRPAVSKAKDTTLSTRKPAKSRKASKKNR